MNCGKVTTAIRLITTLKSSWEHSAHFYFLHQSYHFKINQPPINLSSINICNFISFGRHPSRVATKFGLDCCMILCHKQAYAREERREAVLPRPLEGASHFMRDHKNSSKLPRTCSTYLSHRKHVAKARQGTILLITPIYAVCRQSSPVSHANNACMHWHVIIKTSLTTLFSSWLAAAVGEWPSWQQSAALHLWCPAWQALALVCTGTARSRSPDACEMRQWQRTACCWTQASLEPGGLSRAWGPGVLHGVITSRR